MSSDHDRLEGFKPLAARGEFVASNGPFFEECKRRRGARRFAFKPQAKHCNSLGFVHGGMVATFFDSCMAQSIADAHQFALLTVGLNVSFENLIAKNRWAIAEVNLQERVDDLVVANAVLTARGLVCAKASGEFKLMLKRPLS